MPSFKNILVGIDLTKYRRLECAELHAPARDAVAHAIWLAQRSGGRLLFFAAFNLSEDAFHHVAEHERSRIWSTVEQQADKLLLQLVAQAQQAGVEAERMLVLGQGWLEIIRQVLRGRHDLVVVGTSELSGLRRMLFGDTAVKLLRRCPCPVLVTKEGHGARPLNILVATGLKPTGVEALRVGLQLHRLVGGMVHVLHVVEYPLDFLWGTAYPDVETTEYHHKIRAAAWRALQQQLHDVDADSCGAGIQVHLGEGAGVPDVAIQQFIEAHHIDLLVMGTIARGGVPGIMIGNTAERLLSEVRCSLVAVKPADFHCPVQLGESA
jgi:universal stress protein E